MQENKQTWCINSHSGCIDSQAGFSLAFSPAKHWEHIQHHLFTGSPGSHPSPPDWQAGQNLPLDRSTFI